MLHQQTRLHVTTHMPCLPPPTQPHTPAVCHGPRLIRVPVLSRGTDTWYICPVNPSRITCASAVCCFIYTWNIDVLNLTPRVLRCPFPPREEGRPFLGNSQQWYRNRTLSALGLVDRVRLVSSSWLVHTAATQTWEWPTSSVCIYKNRLVPVICLLGCDDKY